MTFNAMSYMTYIPIYYNEKIVGFKTIEFADYQGSNMYAYPLSFFRSNLNAPIIFDYEGDDFIIKEARSTYAMHSLTSYEISLDSLESSTERKIVVSKNGNVNGYNLDPITESEGYIVSGNSKLKTTDEQIIFKNESVNIRTEITYSLDDLYNSTVSFYNGSKLYKSFENTFDTSKKGAIKYCKYDNSNSLVEEKTDTYDLSSNLDLLSYKHMHPQGYETRKVVLTYGTKGLPTHLNEFMYGQAYSTTDKEYDDKGNVIFEEVYLFTGSTRVFQHSYIMEYYDNNTLKKQSSFDVDGDLSQVSEYTYNDKGNIAVFY